LILRAPHDKTVVVAGGFRDEERVESSNPEVSSENLQAKHEEADTRVILHCVQSDASSIVVAARDTDILVMLISNFHQMKCPHVWLKSGTAKKRKYLPVHTIVDTLKLDPPVLEIMPAFHALTGSDTTSFLAGHSKKTSFKVFVENSNLLKNLGKNLDEQTIHDAESFVCKIYGCSDMTSVNEARAHLFTKGNKPEKLPPTSDALNKHIQRSHYQALVWRQAAVQYPELPKPETMGWTLVDGELRPVLMSLPPVPASCMELSCACSTRCITARCKCRKARMGCTAACKCSDTCRNDL
jgi:hypothetical protein